MDILIAFLILVIAVAVWRGKPIKVEIKHQYPDPITPDKLTDPNKDDGSETEVRDAVANAISALNDIMTGGDLSGADNK